MGAKPISAIQRAFAMIEQRGAMIRQLEAGVSVVLIHPKLSAAQEGLLFLEDAHIASRRDIAGRDIGQPEHVIGTTGAHAAIEWRMPPMQDITLFELMGCGNQDMPPGLIRGGMKQGEHILQLVPIAEGAACLIESRARPDPRTGRLIGQPAVDHQIKGRVRRVDLHCAQSGVPVIAARLKSAFDHSPVLPPVGQDMSVGAAIGLAQHEDNLSGFTGGNVEVNLEGGAAVRSRGLRPATKVPVQQAFRPPRIIFAAKEVGARCRKAMRRQVAGQERSPLPELLVPWILRQHGMRSRVIFRRAQRRGFTMHRTQQPFDIVSSGDAARFRQQVAQPQPDDLHRIVDGHEGEQLLFKPFAGPFPDRVADAMTYTAGGISAGRLRCRRPQMRIFLVPQIEDLRLRILYGIVAPRGQAVFAAVDRPAETQPGLGDNRAETGIGKYVGPGRGSGHAGIEVNEVIALLRETAKTIVEGQIVGAR